MTKGLMMMTMQYSSLPILGLNRTESLSAVGRVNNDDDRRLDHRWVLSALCHTVCVSYLQARMVSLKNLIVHSKENLRV